ncbi:Hypothetical protein PBC10988_17820 [Planctomycetales bacterium 10988]|nr:Hypothetical protein PBC10988_17820 [Planctomycetales bacterium 10988]
MKKFLPGQSWTSYSKGGGIEVSCKGEVRHCTEIINNSFAKKGDATAYRVGLKFVELTGEQLAGLWEISIQYAVQRQYMKFRGDRIDKVKGGVMSLLWPFPSKAGGRGYHLPVHLKPHDEDAEPDSKLDLNHTLPDSEEFIGVGSVTEKISSTSMQALLYDRCPIGQMVEFILGTPFGEVKGLARVTGHQDRLVGTLPLVNHKFEFVRFLGPTRSRLNSLLTMGEQKKIIDSLVYVPLKQRWPVMRPTMFVVAPTVVLLIILTAMFHFTHYDGILLNQIARGDFAASPEDMQRIERLVETKLNQPGVGEEELCLLRDAMLKINRPKEAAELVKRVTEIAPENLDIRLAHANNLMDAGKYDEAEKEFQHLLDEFESRYVRDETRVLGYLSAARNSIKRNQLNEAMARFGRLMEVVPDNVEVRMEFARVLLAAQEPDRALDVLEEADLDSRSRESLVLMANIYAAKKDFPAAESVLQEALAIAPNDPEIRTMAADIASWMGNYGKALVMYEELLENNPDDLDLQMKYGLTLLWDRKYAAAMEQITPLASMTDSEKYGENLWMDFLNAAAGSPVLTRPAENLLARIDREVKTDSFKDITLMTRLADAYINHGNAFRGRQLLERSLRLDENNAEVRLRLADTLHNMGQFELADRHYQLLIGRAGVTPKNSPGAIASGESRRKIEALFTRLNQLENIRTQ